MRKVKELGGLVVIGTEAPKRGEEIISYEGAPADKATRRDAVLCFAGGYLMRVFASDMIKKDDGKIRYGGRRRFKII